MNDEITLHLTRAEAEEVHHALYRRLIYLSWIEDGNPNPVRRRDALRSAGPVISAADKLKALLGEAE